MVEKRSLDGSIQEDGDAGKRPRMAEASPGLSDKAGLPTKPSLSLEALEKAKKVLLMQKALKEKLKNIPQMQTARGIATPAVGTEASGAPSASFMAAAAAAPALNPNLNPAVLAATQKAAQIAASLSAAMGRASSAGGAGALLAQPLVPGGALSVTSARPVRPFQESQFSTGAATPRPQVLPGPPPLPLPLPGPPPLPPLDAPPAFFDPRMGNNALRKLDRRRKTGFEFVVEGTLQKQAELVRKTKAEEDAWRKASRRIGPFAPGDEPHTAALAAAALLGAGEVAAEGEELAKVEPIPDVEWWDKVLLPSGTYEADVKEGSVTLRENKITHLVEHPVPIEPPAEPAPPPPQPLKLTVRERKKLRTQRRQAREKEKQELIRQGLLEPPKPKVRLANLPRVLGEQAAADPTAVEREVRVQMEERSQAHADRNLARKLTPGEARDKKLRKLFDDTGLEVHAAVFRVARLTNPQHKFKIDINAKENHMTGLSIVSADGFSVIVVEGCAKSLRRYSRLMLRRIEWGAEVEVEGEGEGETARMEVEDDGTERRCDMVWQGVVKRAAFSGFNSETVRTPEAGRKLLEDAGVPHYWDVAAAFVPGETPPIELQ